MATIIRIGDGIHSLSVKEVSPLSEMMLQESIMLQKIVDYDIIIFSRPDLIKSKKTKGEQLAALEKELYDKKWYKDIVKDKAVIRKLLHHVYFVDFNKIERLCYFFVRKGLFLKKIFYFILSIIYHIRVAIKLRGLKIDNGIVIINNRPFAFLFKLFNKNIRCILEMQNSHLVSNKVIVQAIINKAVSYFDRIVFASDFLRKEYEPRNRNSPKQSIVYNGVSMIHQNLLRNTKVLFDKPSFISKWKRQFITDSPFLKTDNNIRVLFVARIVPQKGIDILLGAIDKIVIDSTIRNMLDKHNSKIELNLIGAPLPGKKIHSPYLERVTYLKRIIKKIDRFKKDRYLSVNFKGFMDRVKLSQEYARSDIVVVPSIWDEPLGNVNIEGMFFYDTVIASRTGGIPEVVSHQKDGYLFQKGNSTELAVLLSSTIKKILLKDPSLKNLVENAHQKVNRKFLVQHHLKSLLKVCKGLIIHF